MLTTKQESFVATKLKTIMSNTNIRGITYDDFTSLFIVRDCADSQQKPASNSAIEGTGAVIDTFGDLTEAVECLVCEAHGFATIDPDTVFDIISFCGAEKHLR